MTARTLDACPALATSPIRSLLSTLLAATALAGCAAVPGIRTQSDPSAEPFTPAGESAAAFTPAVRPIDANLLAEQRRARTPADAGSTAPRKDVVGGYQYRIGPADVLNVLVWDHPELNNPMGNFQDIEQQARLVREDGTIFFPFIGVVQVAGKTIEEVRDYIARQLEPYVIDPQVDVRVVAFRSKKVYVTGEVAKPGAMPLTDEPLTVMDAINNAGGLGEAADRRRVVLTRDGQQKTLDLLELYASGRGDLLLKDLDVLFVPDNQFNRVFIMGETIKQTAVPLHEGRLSLAEALSAAEGLDLKVADTRNVFVLRGQPVLAADGTVRGIRPEVYHLDTSVAVSLVLAEGFQLQPRDIVYAGTAGLVRFNRVIQQILPAVQVIWQTDNLINN